MSVSMAARLNPRHQQSVRDKIQASQLVNSLQNHVFGKVELSATQVNSAKYLIDQAIGKAPQPITGEDGGPLTLEIVQFTKSDCE